MDQDFFRWLFFALLILIILVRIIGYVSADPIRKALLIGKDISMTIPDLLLFGSIGGSALYCIWPRISVWMVVPFAPALKWVGAFIEIIGILTLFWTHWALGKNYHPGLRIRKIHQLVTWGPYRYVRHPMYVAGLLIMVGGFLLSSSLLLGAMGITSLVWICIYRPDKEETMMLEAFGDEYRAYQKVTRKIFPW